MVILSRLHAEEKYFRDTQVFPIIIVQIYTSILNITITLFITIFVSFVFGKMQFWTLDRIIQYGTRMDIKQ